MRSFNDGVCSIYEEKNTLIHTDFNAKKNAKTLNDFNLIMDSFYSIENVREEDYEFANNMGKLISMKIKIPFIYVVKNNHKILIDGMMYDIIKADADRRNRELFIYLEGGISFEK